MYQDLAPLFDELQRLLGVTLTCGEDLTKKRLQDGNWGNPKVEVFVEVGDETINSLSVVERRRRYAG